MSTSAPFPGGIGITHLRVYDSEGPDGLRGGTPHVHTACTEAYAVVAGSGAVQTLTPKGFEVTPLETGTFAWFTPGTIHRLVNDGDLEILVLMGNAGLPEAGDMVVCFPDEVLADPDAYRAAATLPEGERTTAGSGDAARARRDLGVQGFTALREAMDDLGEAPLVRFYERVASLVAPLADGWRPTWEAGPWAAAQQTGEQLGALARGDASHLREAVVEHLAPPPDERTMGCCGTLGTYVVPPPPLRAPGTPPPLRTSGGTGPTLRTPGTPPPLQTSGGTGPTLRTPGTPPPLRTSGGTGPTLRTSGGTGPPRPGSTAGSGVGGPGVGGPGVGGPGVGGPGVGGPGVGGPGVGGPDVGGPDGGGPDVRRPR